MYDNGSGMYNMYLVTYFHQFMALSDNKKRKLCNKYDPVNLFLETYKPEDWFKNCHKEESVDLSDMPPPEGNEEVKERRGLKILTPNKLLTRFSILLADHTN